MSKNTCKKCDFPAVEESTKETLYLINIILGVHGELGVGTGK